MNCQYCGDNVEMVFHGERQMNGFAKPIQICAKCLVFEAGIYVESKVRA